MLDPFRNLLKSVENAGILLDLAREEADPAQRKEVTSEAEAEIKKAGEIFRRLEMQSLLGGELDKCNVYMSIHTGAGGTESCDWAEMLLRMYRKYCEAHGFEMQMLDIQPGEEAGIKSATFLVSGSFAFGYLRSERGVHRLVRISPFDANKRRHTTFAAADVVAAVEDDVDVEVNESDLRVDTYRSGGAGGQHVNTTDSAIRITHVPTGIVVSCQAERSQHKNRAIAMKMLKAKIIELNRDMKRKEMERFYGKKGEIAWGNQIRSYVLYPYTMVKDHRTDVETSDSAGVLDGDLDRFVFAYLKQFVKEAGTGS